MTANVRGNAHDRTRLRETGLEEMSDLLPKRVAPISHLPLDPKQRADTEVLVSTHSKQSSISSLADTHRQSDGEHCRRRNQTTDEPYGPAHTNLASDLSAVEISMGVTPNRSENVEGGFRTLLSRSLRGKRFPIPKP